MKRVLEHPILGREDKANKVKIIVDGKEILANEGEMVAAALMANGIRIHRYTVKNKEPRGIYCGIGQCTDCVMIVNGKPNIRTCVTPVKEGMKVETQDGVGKRGDKDD